jgi:hypothetical protein
MVGSDRPSEARVTARALLVEVSCRGQRPADPVRFGLVTGKSERAAGSHPRRALAKQEAMPCRPLTAVTLFVPRRLSRRAPCLSSHGASLTTRRVSSTSGASGSRLTANTPTASGATKRGCSSVTPRRRGARAGFARLAAGASTRWSGAMDGYVSTVLYYIRTVIETEVVRPLEPFLS